MFKKVNPFKLILYWLFLLLIAGIVIIPILFATTVGGEQKPLTFLVYLLLTAIYGTLILSIITPFFYFNWFKKYWYINLLAFIISGYYIVKYQRGKAKIEYGFKEETEYIGNDKIKIVKEYYSFSPEKIRSESFWKNEKKDSIWTIYAKDGSIISREKYKNDILVIDRNE